MPKILTTYLLTLSFLSTLTLAQENDIIATITQGAFNQNSQGVRELSRSEMEEVKGGIELYRIYNNGQFVKEYGIISNYGERIYYTAYYEFLLDPYEQLNGVARLGRDGQYSVSNYQDFNFLKIVDPQNEHVTLKTTYDFRTRQVSAEIVIYNSRTQGMRRVPYNPFAQRLYNAFIGYARNWMINPRFNDRYRVDMLYGR